MATSYGGGEEDGRYRWQHHRVAEKLWATDVSACCSITIYSGHVYVIDGKEIYCHSLADGKLLASIDGVGTSTSPQLLSADGKIFYLPEGRHGAPHDVFLFNADPKKFEKITDYWPGMLHVPTTAYAGHNMLYPIVDGRIFARGLDGIFCYDLRAKSQ